MEKFYEHGFQELTQSEISELSNSNHMLIPHLQRYLGLGYVQILVECKIQSENRYILVYIGGENGYSAEDNLTEYCRLNKLSSYQTIDEALDEVKNTPNLNQTF
ncbi:hypothetical protein BH23THE1_BH23THE1_33550 [soil metagenome]